MTPTHVVSYIAFAFFFGAVGLLIAAAHYVVLFEAWRKGLTAFGRWLLPSALASTISTISWLLGVLSPSLGFRTPYTARLCRYGLDTLAAALAAIALFRLWKMIRGWPAGAWAGGEHPPGGQNAEHPQEGIWPPPPTDPA